MLGSKGSNRIDEEVADEEETSRGSIRDLDDGLRDELSSLKPTRSVAVDDDEDADETLSYFAKLASDD